METRGSQIEVQIVDVGLVFDSLSMCSLSAPASKPKSKHEYQRVEGGHDEGQEAFHK